MSTDPYKFERDVADLYRSLGADVRLDVSVAGSQIDIVVVERTSSGSTITRLVECKAYARPVGVHQVRIFALTSNLLRDRRLADMATMVSAKGFTREARTTAEEFNIELLEVADLQARAGGADGTAPTLPSPPRSRGTEPAADGVESRDEQLRVFVAIPFTPRYDDVHILGITAAAQDTGGVAVERADENLDSSEIIDYIKSRIADCDLVLADTTETNPNVYYELGYADGLGKEVLLIAETNTQLPFDLRGRNHLLYENIRELRAKLAGRFKRLLDDG